MVGKWNKSVILTYVGMVFAVLGMVLAFACSKINYSIACLMVAGVCDLFDGMVARRCKRTEEEKAFGIQLDSLVDVISFIALPICISVSIGFTQYWFIILYVVFAISGIARLAYFNVVDADSSGPVKYYTGLPVTYTALIIPVVYLLSFVTDPVLYSVVHLVAMLFISVFGLLKLKVIKPRGIAYGFFGVLAIVLLVLYLFIL